MKKTGVILSNQMKLYSISFLLLLFTSSFTIGQCNFGLNLIGTPTCNGYDDYTIPICDIGEPTDEGAAAHWIFYNSNNIWNIGSWNINNDVSWYNKGVGICHARHYPLRCDKPLVLKYGAFGGPNNCSWTEVRELFEALQTPLDPSFTMSVSTNGNLATVTVTGVPNQLDTWHQFNLVNANTLQVIETIAWWQVNPNRYEEGPFTFTTQVPLGPGTDLYTVQRGVWNACTPWTASTMIVAVSKSMNTEETEESFQFNIAPNPVSTEATVIFSSPADGVLKVFNTLGQEVHHIELAEMDRTNIDVSHLDDGMYSVVMEYLNGKVHREKLVVK